MADLTRNSQFRVWTIENGAGPANVPEYQGCFKPGDFTLNLGDVTRIECPDPNNYDRFVESDRIQGQQERVTFPITGRYPRSLSDLLRLARKKCRVDIHVHLGACRDPQDFNAGWEKKLVFPDGVITSYGLENFGAISSDERDTVNEMAELSAEEVYEVGGMGLAEIGAATVARELISVDICDTLNCGGDCGAASDGCQVVFMTQVGVSATPGTQPSVVYSLDGGATFSTRTITTLFSNEAPSDAECIGENYVVVAQTPCSLHYIRQSDIVTNAGAWTEVNTGFVGTGCPNAIWSVTASKTWIVGQGGYIYFTADPTLGVTVQNAGVATTQNLNDVHALDAENILAVGASNAVVYSANGGATWLAVTGPAVGISLLTAWMLNETTWLVGTAGGELYYTINAGTTWVEVGLPIAATQVDQITFVDETVGYLAARIAGTAGRILKTTDGGRSWKTLPDGAGAIPANDYLNDLAVCGGNHNLVFGAGLADNATDGFAVKGSA